MFIKILVGVGWSEVLYCVDKDTLAIKHPILIFIIDNLSGVLHNLPRDVSAGKAYMRYLL